MKYLNNLMEKYNMTRTDLCEKCGLPESTLRDILNGKTQIDRCEARTLVSLASELETSVEEIVSHYLLEMLDDMIEPVPGKLYDGNSLIEFYRLVNMIRRWRRDDGDASIFNGIRKHHWIESFFDTKSYRCAFFLLGFADYFCRQNHMEPIQRYDAYRKYCLDQPVYAERVYDSFDDPYVLDLARENAKTFAVAELARFNIFMTEEDIAPMR